MSRESMTGIPRLNWAALLIPPVWGVAHGMWSGIFFVPLWVFVDNALRGPQLLGYASLVVGYLMAAVTAALQVAFALSANRVAWRRVAHRSTVESFVRSQRRWAIAAVAIVVAFATPAIIALVA